MKGTPLRGATVQQHQHQQLRPPPQGAPKKKKKAAGTSSVSSKVSTTKAVPPVNWRGNYVNQTARPCMWILWLHYTRMLPKSIQHLHSNLPMIPMNKILRLRLSPLLQIVSELEQVYFIHNYTSFIHFCGFFGQFMKSYSEV